MGTLSASLVLPAKLNPEKQTSKLFYRTRKRSRNRKPQSIVPMARLFGPAIFEASKLKVLFLGVDEEKHPGKLPRTYTLTHSDITSKLTLAISQTINNSQLQGWYNRLQRDEVVAEWKKVKGKMSLHVHCHISGGHLLLDLFARLRIAGSFSLGLLPLKHSGIQQGRVLGPTKGGVFNRWWWRRAPLQQGKLSKQPGYATALPRFL
nr:protein STAY-GREEN, chloroplastic-like [Ipomoea batatas]